MQRHITMGAYFVWHPRQESDLDLQFRKLPCGPLHYGDINNRRRGTYKPVLVLGNHLSRRHVTMSLKHPTRRWTRTAPLPAYSGLLQAGFALTPLVAKRAVGSYPTFSPLPTTSWAVIFCGTFPEVSLGGRYPRPCPLETGLSSSRVHLRVQPSGLAADFLAAVAWFPDAYCMVPLLGI